MTSVVNFIGIHDHHSLIVHEFKSIIEKLMIENCILRKESITQKKHDLTNYIIQENKELKDTIKELQQTQKELLQYFIGNTCKNTTKNITTERSIIPGGRPRSASPLAISPSPSKIKKSKVKSTIKFHGFNAVLEQLNNKIQSRQIVRIDDTDTISEISCRSEGQR